MHCLQHLQSYMRFSAAEVCVVCLNIQDKLEKMWSFAPLSVNQGKFYCLLSPGPKADKQRELVCFYSLQWSFWFMYFIYVVAVTMHQFSKQCMHILHCRSFYPSKFWKQLLHCDVQQNIGHLRGAQTQERQERHHLNDDDYAMVLNAIKTNQNTYLQIFYGCFRNALVVFKTLE